MLKRLSAIAALGGLVAIVAAAPAVTAPNVGTVNATVTVNGSACVTVSKTSINFGSAGFAQPGSASQSFDPNHGNQLTVSNCGSEATRFWMGATNAFDTNAPAGGPYIHWTIDDQWVTCNSSLNRYGIFQSQPFNGQYLSGLALADFDHLKALWRYTDPAHSNDGSDIFQAGEHTDAAFTVYMPCAGSDGSGRTMGMTIGFVAVLV